MSCTGYISLYIKSVFLYSSINTAISLDCPMPPLGCPPDRGLARGTQAAGQAGAGRLRPLVAPRESGRSSAPAFSEAPTGGAVGSRRARGDAHAHTAGL